MLDRPEAVLLDVGGVFFLPGHDPIGGAMRRGGFDPDPTRFDRAHYVGAAQLPLDRPGDEQRAEFWDDYLDAYCRECAVPDALFDDVREHVRAEFNSLGAWSRIVPGSRAGLEALAATGVTVGIVSNADGTVAARLLEREVAQVGPGPGVPVAFVIDSGLVGVSKPDPRIFRAALSLLELPAERAWYVGDVPGIDVAGARAAGLHPVLMDPYDLHVDAGVDRAPSLSAVAALVSR